METDVTAKRTLCSELLSSRWQEGAFWGFVHRSGVHHFQPFDSSFRENLSVIAFWPSMIRGSRAIFSTPFSLRYRAYQLLGSRERAKSPHLIDYSYRLA